ncbi:hypothetical protein CSUI_004597 [Cystoisospora suis]|uniref:Uncharacterized protein n=1 Tax=Cystoisospora suis TaxID=483139 RepID=A0A2C6L0B9_9APIC|nr:hypothetical protein CSUI_004597 [Cystoisospora suis]
MTPWLLSSRTGRAFHGCQQPSPFVVWNEPNH